MCKKNPIKNVDYIHDYNHCLGINVNASIDEIKKTYKQKSKEYHQDLETRLKPYQIDCTL